MSNFNYVPQVAPGGNNKLSRIRQAQAEAYAEGYRNGAMEGYREGVQNVLGALSAFFGEEQATAFFDDLKAKAEQQMAEQPMPEPEEPKPLLFTSTGEVYRGESNSNS